jgi:hypothetical protein
MLEVVSAVSVTETNSGISQQQLWYLSATDTPRVSPNACAAAKRKKKEHGMPTSNKRASVRILEVVS